MNIRDFVYSLYSLQNAHLHIIFSILKSWNTSEDCNVKHYETFSDKKKKSTRDIRKLPKGNELHTHTHATALLKRIENRSREKKKKENCYFNNATQRLGGEMVLLGEDDKQREKMREREVRGMYRCVPEANLVRSTCHFTLTHRILNTKLRRLKRQ